MTYAGPPQADGQQGAQPPKLWPMKGERPAKRNYRWTEMWLLLAPALFMLFGLTALLIINGQHIDLAARTLPPLDAFTPVIGLILALLGAHFALIFIAPEADETLLPIAGLLSSIGVLMALRLGQDLNQTSLGWKQLVFVIAGLALCIFTVWATKKIEWLTYPYSWAIIGVALVAVTLVHAGSFDPTAPSRDVLSIGGGAFSFQPSELFKICLVIFFAGYLSSNLSVLSAGGYRKFGITFPPLKNLLPLLLVLGLALAIVVFARELGLAVLILGVFLSMLYAATRRLSYFVLLGGVFAVGAVIIFNVFSYARDRVSLLTQAFDINVYLGRGSLSSYQIVQGLVAFGSGGVFGQGLGLGHPTFVPASTTDYVAAAFAEEFGFAGLLALIGLFMLLIFRGMRIATRSREPFNQLMALGLTAVFGLQTVVILAGNLKLMPLTGVPLPFVAYGGSSLLANFIIIGLLLRLSQEYAKGHVTEKP